MRKIFAIFIAKCAIIAGRILKRGSSLPGLLALKISPNITEKINTKKAIKIAVTGANGKSTTTVLLAQIFKEAGFKVAANLKGSNMRPGVLTGILEKTSLLGNVHADIILMEVDEFSSPKIYGGIAPDYLVMTNVLRDHIERQSDIENVIKKIEQKLPNTTTLVLNADDPIVRNLHYGHDNPRIFYGIDDIKHIKKTSTTAVAAKFCLHCGAKLIYDAYFYEHIGHYHCPVCDFRRPVPDYRATEIMMHEHTMTINNQNTYKVNYDAFYMYYNILAAITMAKILTVDENVIQRVTNHFIVGNARLQEFYLYNRLGVMNFLKNSTSLSATIDLILTNQEQKTLAFVMDDTYDGRYFITQWYWDAHVEKLAEDKTIDYFVCTWRRCYDMAVRLRAAGIPEEKIYVEPDMEKAVTFLRENTKGKVYLGYDTDSHSINKVVKALAKYPENEHLRK